MRYALLINFCFVFTQSILAYESQVIIKPLDTSISKNNLIQDSNQFSFLFNDTLKNSLQLFAKNNNYKIHFSNNLSSNILGQIINGRFSVNSNDELLNTLSKIYGFEWFIYSDDLFITTKQNITASVEVNSSVMSAIRDSLKQLGLLNPRFGYSEFVLENKVVISGPKEYVNLITSIINGFDVKPLDQQFAVYRLKYASATDILLNFNNQRVIIPGVATILRSLIQGQNLSNLKGSNYLNNSIIEPLTNEAKKLDNSNGAANTDNSSDIGSGIKGSTSMASLQADPRLNTIVIRDKASNLMIYKKLIELLDVPAPLVQVDVLVIYLNQEELAQYGVNWWGSANTLAAGYNAAKLSGNITNDLAVYYGQVNPGQILVSNINNFALSLQFLEKNNIAKAVSKPSLVTTDNLPAILEVTENLYLNSTLQNLQSNNNQNTSSSTLAQVNKSLQITPHVIFDDNNQRQIKLSIVLEDGSVNEINNTSMPSTTQSSLTSQAVINEGQSIILAGYTRDMEQNILSKVPLLGDIPLLGWFFKSNNKVKHKVTTLYFVTPKIIWAKDMYKLKSFVNVDSSKFDISDTYTIVPRNSTSNVK